LSSSLTVIAGNVDRRPVYFMARSTDPSIPTPGWHPHQFLAAGPKSLFEEYVTYRAAVLDKLMEDAGCRSTYGPDLIERVVDLVHLQYLAPMLSRPVIDHMLDGSLAAGLDPNDLIAGLWSTFINQAARKPPSPLVHLKQAFLDPRHVARIWMELQRR